MTTNFITLTNVSRSNLEAFFDGLSATPGLAPTLLFDTNGLGFSQGVTDAVSLQMSLASGLLGPGHELVLAIDGVSLFSEASPDGASLTLLPGLLTGSIRFDGRELATFTVDNADTDVLTVSQGVNGMPALSLKLDSLLARIMNGTNDALQIANLTASDAAAVASVVLRAAIADKTPAELQAWLKELITLPAELDTVGELAQFVQQVFTLPGLSSLTFGNLLSLAQSGAFGDGFATEFLLSVLSSVADLSPSMSLSEALTAIQANPDLANLSVSSLLAGELSPETIDALASAGITAEMLQTLLNELAASGQPLTLAVWFDGLVVGALHLLEASGLSLGDALELLIGSVDDPAALSMVLGAVDLTQLGLDQNWLSGILLQIRDNGSVDLADLLPIAAKTFLAADASLTLDISDTAGLGITSDGKLIESASVTVPLGDANEQTAPLVYDFGNDAPVAQPAIAEVLEGETVSGLVQAIDPDVGDLLNFALVDPGNAPVGLTFNADGSWSFDASSYGSLAQGEQQVIEVAFTATDAGGLSSSSTLSITVNGVDEAFPVSGMVYHWKNHALLSDVALSLGGVDPLAVNSAYELRNIAVDAQGQVSVEVWVDAGAGVSNLDLELGFVPGTAGSFTLDAGALPGWIITRSDTDGAVDISALTSSSVVAGQFKLGTLSLGEVGAIDTALTVTGLVGTQQVGYQAVLGSTSTGADGHFVFDGVQSGQYALLAYKPLGAGETGSVINSADALAALKLAVGRDLYNDPDGDGPLQAQAVSPYQFIAADANEDGRVTSADALEILKMAVFRSDAIPREWLFVSESADFWDEVEGKFTIDKDSVVWERGSVDLGVADTGLEQNLVAVLKGDVNGNWAAPVGSEVVDSSHFAGLVGLDMAPWEQWGIASPGPIA